MCSKTFCKLQSQTCTLNRQDLQISLLVPSLKFFLPYLSRQAREELHGVGISLNQFQHTFSSLIRKLKCLFNKFFDCVSFSCSYHIVVRFFLLKHQPHGFNIVSCKSPVSFCIKIAQIKLIL